MKNFTEDIILGNDALKKRKINLSYENDEISVLNEIIKSKQTIDLRKEESNKNETTGKLLTQYNSKTDTSLPITNAQMTIELTMRK